MTTNLLLSTADAAPFSPCNFFLSIIKTNQTVKVIKFKENNSTTCTNKESNNYGFLHHAYSTLILTPSHSSKKSVNENVIYFMWFIITKINMEHNACEMIVFPWQPYLDWAGTGSAYADDPGGGHDPSLQKPCLK